MVCVGNIPWCFHCSLMAENTRLKELVAEINWASDSITILDDPNKETQQHLDQVEMMMSSIQRTHDTLTRAINHLSLPPSIGDPHSLPLLRHVKLDFPRFDDSDPVNWLFCAEQFFAYYDTPDSQQLLIASVHFEGFVVPWFQMLHKVNQIPTRIELACAVEEKFGPSQFDSPQA